MDIWTEGLSSFLANGQQQPSVPFQVALSMRTSMQEDPGREKNSTMEVNLLYSSHRSGILSLLSILVIISKSLDPAYTKGERII